ncbi:hypothetical protein NC652_018481 [Populus alba x Populus x berolinensis]|nr:hypothetical protein NC652_018481 [Populus alba x Populus x berolinensis]
MASSASGTQVRASHILIKHEGSRRKASWKDPEGRVIKNTTRDSAISQLKAIREDIVSGKAKFEDVASRISDCSSAKRGGDLGKGLRENLQEKNMSRNQKFISVVVYYVLPALSTPCCCHCSCQYDFDQGPLVRRPGCRSLLKRPPPISLKGDHGRVLNQIFDVLCKHIQAFTGLVLLSFNSTMITLVVLHVWSFLFRVEFGSLRYSIKAIHTPDSVQARVLGIVFLLNDF